MTDQPALFDPRTTTAQACPAGHCQAIRTPGQQGRLLTCAHDLDPQRKRPRGCLNAAPDPRYAEIPF